MRFKCTLVFACALITASCDSGGRSGIIRGIVSDGAHARVCDAIVVVVNESADNSIGLKTDHAGEFTASGLQPGKYRVAVRKAGFQSALRTNVVVDANSVVNVDLNLVAGPDSAADPVNTKEGR
jgi:hypothetical protein